MAKITYLIFALLFVSLISCHEWNNQAAGPGMNNLPLKSAQVKGLFEYLDATTTGLSFVNNMPDSMAIYVFMNEYAFNGGGVAIGDVNNDGLSDVYFSSTFDSNRLYLNLGGMKFKDITQETGVTGGAGLKTGVTMVDINDDGLLDIYVCKSGQFPDPAYRANALYVNKGNLKFEEAGAKYGLQDVSYSTQSYFADFDTDGDLDMYLVNHPLGWAKKHALDASQDESGKIVAIEDTFRVNVSDRLYINNGGKFVDKTKAFGVDNIAFGLSAAVFDANGDGYPDIYVANDYAAPDYLYVNQGGKYFKKETEKYFNNIPNNSMGSDMLDANNDGRLDLYVNDMMPEKDNRMKVTMGIIKNYDSHVLARKLGYHDQFRYNTFQINNGDGHFSNYGFYTGTTNTDWSWAPLSEDFDHNGYQDLFITNGYLKDIIHLDYIKYQMDSLRKISHDNTEFAKAWTSFVKPFKLVNYFYANNGAMQFDKVSDIWADGRASFSNGSAYGDLDNDGDLDLVVNNFNEAAFLMKNTISEKKESHFVSIQLNGNKGNRHGVGSELIIHFDDGSLQKKIFQPTRGFYSSVDYRLGFGFPMEKKIATIDVLWPDRSTESFGSINGNKIILNKGKGIKTLPAAKIPTYFADGPFPFVHAENEYVDFKREPLLHLKNSTDGPCIATADVNGDGKEEIYIGGAHEQAGVLLKEKSPNQWQKMEVSDFEIDKIYEDTGAAFADFDADGDQDLVVVSGGYQWPQGDNHYAVRYYRNDGKGGFNRDQKAIPHIFTNASCVVTGDWDGDKDPDVFIGGGAVPGSYPLGDQSYYLQNDKGIFSTQPKSLPEELNGTMVKAGISDDLDGDKKPDLVTAGDYQPIRIFSFANGFTLKHSIHKSDGLWQSLLAVDVDGDGTKEIIGGNLGKNSFMVANEENPACIYFGDFDDNGEMDAIHCINREGKNYPVHSMDEIQTHMTSLRKKYLRYSQYANQTPEDIFGDRIKKAKLFYVYNYATTLYKKSGNEYLKHELPLEAQLSMVKCLSTIEVNGQTYLAGAGNFYDTDYDYGKYDASKGFMVKLDATFSFSAMKNSGFNAYGNVRSMAVLSNHRILICGNNERCKLYAAQPEWLPSADQKLTGSGKK